MSDKKGFFQRVIGAFLGIFASAAKELWGSLSEEEQAALKSGSGVMKIISDHIDETPEEIVEIIKTQYPDVPLETLSELAAHFNLGVGAKVEDAIAAIQTWLKSKEGTVWDNAMNIAAQTLSFFLSGKEARPGIIAALAESVYRWFIKKK